MVTHGKAGKECFEFRYHMWRVWRRVEWELIVSEERLYIVRRISGAKVCSGHATNCRGLRKNKRSTYLLGPFMEAALCRAPGILEQVFTCAGCTWWLHTFGSSGTEKILRIYKYSRRGSLSKETPRKKSEQSPIHGRAPNGPREAPLRLQGSVEFLGKSQSRAIGFHSKHSIEITWRSFDEDEPRSTGVFPRNESRSRDWLLWSRDKSEFKYAARSVVYVGI